RKSPRNRYVAEALNEIGLGTLLFDPLTVEEEAAEALTRHLRFDIGMLAGRLTGAVDWAAERDETSSLRLGLFGASTGAAAALVTAARRPKLIGAVVSRGGRPDLAEETLPEVKAPTLLIVGGQDGPVIDLNRKAAARMRCTNRIEIIPGATHLFEEVGALEQVAELARRWFAVNLMPEAASPRE
ncbi:MAG: dienelactone hydrolase family protein, partial [Planctomycetota bacterium]